MAEESVSYLLSVINQQIKSQEELSMYLRNLEAMMQITVSAEFLNRNKSTIHDFLCAISDAATLARKKKRKHAINIIAKVGLKFKISGKK